MNSLQLRGVIRRQKELKIQSKASIRSGAVLLFEYCFNSASLAYLYSPVCSFSHYPRDQSPWRWKHSRITPEIRSKFSPISAGYFLDFQALLGPISQPTLLSSPRLLQTHGFRHHNTAYYGNVWDRNATLKKATERGLQLGVRSPPPDIFELPHSAKSTCERTTTSAFFVHTLHTHGGSEGHQCV